MSTLFDYLDWRGDLTFEQSDINEVDNLIFSMISYISFDGILTEHTDKHPLSLLSVARQYVRAHRGQTESIGLLLPYQLVQLLARAAKTKRFGGVRMIGYVNEICEDEQMQFSAVTFLTDNHKSFLSFRGTDDTLVGWKEDFNMSFLHPVPAQLAAVNYLERMAEQTEGPILLGGHSKGGNLAVYASVEASSSVKERIEAVYNNDGPGFTTDFIQSEAYLATRDRIHTIVPQSSVIGMLLEHEEAYTVIQSSASGLFQHSGLSWQVQGPSFVHLDTVTEESRKIDRGLKKWFGEMTVEQQTLFIDSIYECLIAEDAKTLTDLDRNKRKLFRAWNQLDAESKAMVKRCVSILLRENARWKKHK